MKVGVLAVQGAIEEHSHVLAGLIGKDNVLAVRTRQELDSVDALVIPGGESTTISRLLVENGLFARVKELGNRGLPILGTCAGMIVLAKEGDEQVERAGQKLLGLLDVRVRRNAFGRQKDSFETELSVPVLGKKPFPGVFIRAPAIEKVLSDKVEVLAEFDGRIVAVRQGKLVALAFHPELSGDTRFHEYFLSLV